MPFVTEDQGQVLSARGLKAVSAAGVGAGIWMLLLELTLAHHGPLPSMLAAGGRFHPLIVHLPIGVLLLVALSELSTLRRSEPLLGAGTGVTLWLAALGALAAYTAGFVLSREGGYEPNLLTWHRRLAAAIVIGSFASLWTWHRAAQSETRGARRGYHAALALTMLVLGIGAHFGGSLSHGPTYLTENLPDPLRRLLEPKPAGSAHDAAGKHDTVFASLVQPLLDRRCTGCHGAHKSKGGLRLDSLAAILKGGEHGRVVVPGNSAKSRLIERLSLPLDDEHHMPPESKPQPKPNEIALIRAWIDTGAQPTMPLDDLPSTVAPASRSLVREPESAPKEPATADSAHDSDAASAASDTPTESAPTHESHGSTAAQTAVEAPVADSSGPPVDVWNQLVRPILVKRCGNCHGPVNQKAKLRLDDYDAALRGSKHGRVIVPGKPAQSPLLRRLLSPIDDDDHMPPSTRPQPTAAERATLRWWVGRGAPREAPLPAGLAVGGTAPAKSPATVAGEPAHAPIGAPAPEPTSSAEPTLTPAAAGSSESAALASSAVQPSQTAAQSSAGTPSPGPTNGRANAPEPAHPPPGCGCGIDAPARPLAPVVLLLVGVLVASRRARRPRTERVS